MQTNTRKSALRSAVCGTIMALLVIAPLATANARWLEKGRPELPYGVYFQGLQGSVVLSLVLDRSGHVTDTAVLRSSGHPALDELARAAAMNWRLGLDSVLPSDSTKGRVELITFRNPRGQYSRALLPGSEPYWAQLR